MFATSLAFTCMLLAAEPHFKANPVFHELLTEGVEVGLQSAELPSPSMPDGLDALAQRETLEAIVGRAYSLDVFQRDSIVAPQITHMNDVPITATGGRLRRLDVWFIAYGELETIANKEFLEGLLGSDSEQGEGKALTGDDLAKRGISIPGDSADQESYAYGAFELLNKVKISGTTHSYWSKTDDSIIAASKLDPRFTGDAEFPNQWRPLVRSNTGDMELGAAEPYQGSGEYLKITRLASPAGALLVELHVAYVEPEGWFGGTNLLTSKIPAVVQNQVRAVRRELAKAK
ncbi:MAG: hypothetical protein RIC55_13880 [Pirellulaceae bacterium]